MEYKCVKDFRLDGKKAIFNNSNVHYIDVEIGYCLDIIRLYNSPILIPVRAEICLIDTPNGHFIYSKEYYENEIEPYMIGTK